MSRDYCIEDFNQLVIKLDNECDKDVIHKLLNTDKSIIKFNNEEIDFLEMDEGTNGDEAYTFWFNLEYIDFVQFDYKNKEKEYCEKVYYLVEYLLKQGISARVSFFNTLNPFEDGAISFLVKDSKITECLMPKYVDNKKELKRMMDPITEYDEFPYDNYRYIREYGGTFFADERGEEDLGLWEEFNSERENISNIIWGDEVSDYGWKEFYPKMFEKYKVKEVA